MTHLLTDHAGATPSTPGWLDLGQIDPRARILGALAFAVVVTGLSHLAALTVALAAAVLLLALSHLPFWRTLRRMAMMDGFILFMLLTLPFTTPGQPVWTVTDTLIASREGVRLAVEIALTANAAILALLVLVGTQDPVTLGHALARLRVPLRLVHLLLFTVRYIEVLRAEYARMRQAMRARAFRPGSNRHTWRSLGHLVGMMLVRALERSERVLQAMKCRGFTGQIHLLDEMSLGPQDRLFGIGVSTALVALIALEVWLGQLA